MESCVLQSFTINSKLLLEYIVEYLCLFYVIAHHVFYLKLLTLTHSDSMYTGTRSFMFVKLFPVVYYLRSTDQLANKFLLVLMMGNITRNTL